MSAMNAEQRRLNQMIDRFGRQDAVPESHRRIVDRLQRCIQEKLRAAEVYPGGSYAKGTSIGDKSDVDLLVVLNSRPTHGQEKTWVERLVDEIKDAVARDFPVEVRSGKTTRFAFQVSIQRVEFDILPVPAELWNMSPAERQRRLHDASPEDRRWLSVAFTKEQVDFVKSRKETAGVTGIIRLLKHWSDNQKWGGREYKPKNFCIELLIIQAKEDAGGPHDKVKIVDKFWGLVANPENLRVTFGTEPHASIAGQRLPFVVDPANSTNNVAAEFDWSEFKAHAKRFSGAGGVSAFVRDLSQYVAV